MVETDEHIDSVIARRQIPPVLYRYRAFDPFTEASISKGKQMFSSPFEFNDPFDCQIQDNGKYTHADLVTFFKKRGLNQEQSDQGADKHFKMETNERLELLRRTAGNGHNHLGLLCLSERPDSILMWSHYAKAHKGYVLGFTIKKDRNFFVSPHKVNYAGEYPDVSYIKNTNAALDICLITKSNEWAYEREVRVLKSPALNAPASGLRAYKKDCLTEVILGCRVSDEDRKKMKRLLSDDPAYSHVVLKQATVSPTSFAVDIETI